MNYGQGSILAYVQSLREVAIRLTNTATGPLTLEPPPAP